MISMIIQSGHRLYISQTTCICGLQFLCCFLIIIAERISAKQPNPGCILAKYTCPSRLGMSNVTLRKVNLLRLGMLLRTVGSQLGVLPRVPRPVQTDDFSAGKRLHWSENSGTFMEGSCSSGHGAREAGPARAHS